MRRPNLSLQQVPPLGLPMGYFLVGPWFGVFAGVFLACHGTAPWLSRWHPAVLGATHLLILGCIVMVMMGALLQVLAVISAASVPAAGRTAGWIRPLLGIGATALAMALAYEVRALFYLAGACLLASFGVYLVPLVRSLSRRVGGGDSILAIRIAVLCLLVAVALGLLLVAGHVAPDRVPGFRSFTSVHLAFGLVGWTTLVIMAVGFQILPMFFVAPDYPRWITVGVPVAIPIGITTGSTWILGGALLVWAVATIRVLHRRKRRAPDPVVGFWQLAAVFLLLAIATYWFAPARELTIGVLFVIGFVLTVMLGMLHKIVPFLVFLHLQRACLARPELVPKLPTMNEVIPGRRARWQFGIHVFAVTACLAATAYPALPAFPALGPLAAGSLAVSCAWSGVSMRIGWQCYRRKLEEFGCEDTGRGEAGERDGIRPLARG